MRSKLTLTCTYFVLKKCAVGEGVEGLVKYTDWRESSVEREESYKWEAPLKFVKDC